MNKIATYSTMFTVSAAMGFLCSAILTDNGSALVKMGSDVIALDPARLGIEYDGGSVQVSSADETAIIDRIITGAIKRPGNDDNIKVQTVKAEKIEVSAPETSPVLEEITSQKSVQVKPGDTLYGIARTHSLSVHEIAEINGLTEPYMIRPGQKLVVVK